MGTNKLHAGKYKVRIFLPCDAFLHQVPAAVNNVVIRRPFYGVAYQESPAYIPMKFGLKGLSRTFYKRLHLLNFSLHSF